MVEDAINIFRHAKDAHMMMHTVMTFSQYEFSHYTIIGTISATTIYSVGGTSTLSAGQLNSQIRHEKVDKKYTPYLLEFFHIENGLQEN